MEYNDDDLIKISEYAGLLMTITDIAVLMNIDEDELRSDITDKSTEVSRGYRLSKTQMILELHRQEIALAKLGSPMAVELTQTYILNQYGNE